MEAYICSKAPHNTLFLELNYNQNREDVKPLSLALLTAGWKVSGFPPHTYVDEDGNTEISFGKSGNGLFAGWDKKEKKRFQAELLAILDSFSIETYRKKLTLADCL